MPEEKIAAITEYLKDEFTDFEVETREDVYESIQMFRILPPHPKSPLLLKIPLTFIEDNNSDEILRKFNLWSLAENLRNENKLGVSISDKGLDLFNRF